MTTLKYKCVQCDKKFKKKVNANDHEKHFYHRIEEIIVRKRLTFGEEIEISGLKDEILNEVEKDGNYSSTLITIKLRKIARISKKEANNAIVECGLETKGWSKQ